MDDTVGARMPPPLLKPVEGLRWFLCRVEHGGGLGLHEAEQGPKKLGDVLFEQNRQAADPYTSRR
ncbi:hypothetical protein [Streptomyces sp. NPDC059928]|uniref:hypothetical protein n=1 Tax=unclassified Streptomyces TaxID=2593676 RepID=UPI0036618694